MEESVERYDVGMHQKSLNFQLPNKLLEQSLSDYLFLLHDLHSEDHPSINLFDHEDFSKFALSEFGYNSEILSPQ